MTSENQKAGDDGENAQSTSDIEHFCQCRCGDMSGVVETKEDAKEWYERHEQRSTTGMHKPSYGTVGGDGCSG